MKSYRTNFTAILIAETLAMLGFGLSVPVIPLFLEEEIGITAPVTLKAWVGIIQFSTGFTLAVFAPIWGHLADIYSRRAMLLRAMFGGAIVIFFMTFVNNPWQLLVLRSIQGCLTGTVAAATVLTASISPAAQVAFALGLLQTGIAVGNSLGPLVGGVLSDFFGYRAAFFSTSLALALAGIIVLKWVDDFQPAPEVKTKKSGLFPDIRPIIASPVLVAMLMTTFGVNAANTVATPMLPLFLKSLAMKISEEPMYIGSSTGIVLGVGAAFAALAALLVGKFSTSLGGYWTTLIFCLFAGMAITIPQAFVTNMLQLTILRAISSFFIGGTLPVINAIIAISSEKKNQGTVYGFNSALGSAGIAVGPLIGSATAMLSFRVMFLVNALVLGLSGLVTIKRAPSKK